MSATRHQADGLSPASDQPTPWLAVAGAKGGVGKTMLASNLALLLARAGYRTLLVDFDPGCGNVGVQLRISSRHDLEDVAAGTCAAHEAIADGPGRLRVLLGRSGPSTLASASNDYIDRLLAAVETAAAEFDVVVVDTGAGLGQATLAVIERADVTLGVTTPEVTSLTDAYALCKVLHHRGHALPQLVVNRTKNREEAMRTAAKLSTVTSKFLGIKSQLCGWISQDSMIELSIRDQRPLALFGQGHGLEDLRSICAAALAALPPVARRHPTATAVNPVRLRPASPVQAG